MSRADVFEAETHCVDLTETTIKANQRFFASIDDVPRQAYTMGIKTIMQAKKVLVVISGKDKAAAPQGYLLRPDHPSGAGLHPPAAQRRDDRSGRGCIVRDIIRKGNHHMIIKMPVYIRKMESFWKRIYI